MRNFKLTLITPKKVVLKREVSSVTAPSADGEITVLYNHTPLFSLLHAGVVKIKEGHEETFFSIGGGYLETTGREVHLLVSHAAGQDEINEAEVAQAIEQAKRDIKEAPDDAQRARAMSQLRRSMVDMKLVRRVPRRPRAQTSE